MKFTSLIPGDLWVERSSGRLPKEKRAIFFDLDGTMWEEKGPGGIMNVRLKHLPNEAALRALASGWTRVAISNQTYFGRLSRFKLVQAIKYRLKLKGLIRRDFFDVVSVCHHHPDSNITYLRNNCNSRKPNSGQFSLAIQKLQLDPGQCIAIGDRITDVIAASNAGIKQCFLISNRRAFEINISNYPINNVQVFRVVSDLSSFLDYIEKR